MLRECELTERLPRDVVGLQQVIAAVTKGSDADVGNRYPALDAVVSGAVHEI